MNKVLRNQIGFVNVIMLTIVQNFELFLIIFCSLLFFHQVHHKLKRRVEQKERKRLDHLG